MKTTDFRLGNWVNYKGENKHVTSIDEEHLNLNSEGFENSNGKYEQVWHSYDDSIESIPLTPEILLKAGFSDYQEFDNADEHWKIKTKQHNLLIIKLNGVYYATIYFQVVLNSLHQLQNLYYSLTGIELDIKL